MREIIMDEIARLTHALTLEPLFRVRFGLRAHAAECKIVYETATLDELRRYRDAGVTEFNLASSGDIPVDDTRLRTKFDEWQDQLVGPIGEL